MLVYLFILTALIILGIAYYLIINQRKRTEKERMNFLKTEHAQEINRKEISIRTLALQLGERNHMLENIKRILSSTPLEKKAPIRLVKRIDENLKDTTHWKKFTRDYEYLNREYFLSLKDKYEISSSDIKLIALIQMNLTIKEMASVLNVSDEGVKKARFRLRKKMNLNSADSLEDALYTN